MSNSELNLVDKIVEYLLDKEGFRVYDLAQLFRPNGIRDSQWNTTWWSALERLLKFHSIVFNPLGKGQEGKYKRADANTALKRALRFSGHAKRKAERSLKIVQVAGEICQDIELKAKIERAENRLARDLVVARVSERRSQKERPPGI